MKLHHDREMADRVAERIKLFAQGQRLMILTFLLDGEHTVGEIETATAIGQPALSQQLAELRRGELVKTRRESKQIYYRLADETVTGCVTAIASIFGGENPPAVQPPQPRPSPATKEAGAARFAEILFRS